MALVKNRLDSESFGAEGRHFFVDLMKARNNKPYLQITRADYKNQQFYERSSVILFEEDFSFLIEALSMVLTRYTHGENGKNQRTGAFGAAKGKVDVPGCANAE